MALPQLVNCRLATAVQVSDVAHGPITMVERFPRDRPKSMKTGSGSSTAKQWANGIGIYFIHGSPSLPIQEDISLGVGQPSLRWFIFL